MTGQFLGNYLSPALREFVAYYSNRISYQEVEDLVERVTGFSIISDQAIWSVVTNKALEISGNIESEIQEINSLVRSEIEIDNRVNIYDQKTEEILLFDDGIGVKKQKAQRLRRANLNEKMEREDTCKENQNLVTSEELKDQRTQVSKDKKPRKTVITDVVLLLTPKGNFEYIISPIDGEGNSLFSLETSIKSKLKLHYHNYNCPLPIVAITDGASNIRKRLNQLGNQGITIILDWYHLCKKIREYLSMICRNKSERIKHSKFLFFNLWRGKITESLNYLQTKIITRNQQKLDELITYFPKHKNEIINYELRYQAGKTIGSGRMEKAVDLTIGHRQKHKARSWTPLGSRALAILKVVELNGQWQQTWFPSAV